MDAQKQLDGAKYVTGSLVIPTIYDLRQELASVAQNVEASGAYGEEPDVSEAKELVFPCVRAMSDDFDKRWGDGTNILTFAEGKRLKRRRPQGFKTEQVLATALDPRTKMLYGILEAEQEDVWFEVQRAAVKIEAASRNAQPAQGGASSATTVDNVATRQPPVKKVCTGFMAVN